MDKNSKARVMEKLHNECTVVNTLPYYIVDSKRFFECAEKVIGEILKRFPDDKLAVRSSYSKEDTAEGSNAGKYCSVLNVASNEEQIEKAIRQVYGSYESCIEEEVLIQPMLSGIVKSGVIFTRNINTFAPYYCIDYMEGSDSAAVTSGLFSGDRVVCIYKNVAVDSIRDADIRKLVECVRNVEAFFKDDALDIEFAITAQHEVYIFQVRPIAGKRSNIAEGALDDALLRISKKVEKLMREHPFLYGETTCFGVMPDWNPAEILGIRPKKLAISLYKELVTDNIWAQQREDYGYRNITQHPLMVLFCGIPYIDTRVSFNSFVPASLSEGIARKLVNYYITRLKECPAYHDKVEFEVVFSCYYLGVSEKLKCLLDFGFNENEIKRVEYSLLDLTNKIISPQNGLYKKDLQKIDILIDRHNKIMQSNLSTIDKIYWLLEVCKTYGTLPFAGVARAAFIAVQFLQSLVAQGIITECEQNQFMQSLNTISRQIGCDIQKMAEGHITKEDFLKKNGHIRPGTYDIQSARYDENFEYYFGGGTIGKAEADAHSFAFTKEQLAKIDAELEQNGIVISAAELVNFMREAIEGREYLKFVFTKTVSEILRLIERYGKRLGIEKQDLAHLDIGLIKQLYSDLYSGNIKDVFCENIRINKEQYEIAQIIMLPVLIVEQNDVYGFTMFEEEPNYITVNKTSGKVVVEEGIYDGDLEGKVVFIKSADPGYDFLFTKNIAGLITQYGGANSHMAIRCSEQGICAVIGVGEKRFDEWSRADKLFIDCANKNVRMLGSRK